MKRTTHARRRWIRDNAETASVRECMSMWGVTYNLVWHDEKVLGVRLRRDRVVRPRRDRSDCKANSLADDFLRGRL